jgi:hypothetical protein
MATDTHSIAACLGVDEDTIRRLQARGYLLRFDLTEREVRRRLYDAHLAHLRRRRVLPTVQSRKR